MSAHADLVALRIGQDDESRLAIARDDDTACCDRCRDAFLGEQEVVPFAEAEGRIAAEPLATYPPGIPNVLPGERLTRETLEYITDSVDHGGYVRGAADRELTTLRVIAE